MAGSHAVVSLGSVANVRSGFAFKSSDMGDTGSPLIKIKNVAPPTVEVTDCDRIPDSVIATIPGVERYAILPGDILIAMTGATVGKVGRFPLTRERFYLNQRVGKVYLTAPDKADYRFLYYVLSQDTHVSQMFGTADGSAQANISGEQIERLEIPMPSLPEQRAIAHILGTLDDKIELNRRMNETLEAIARALFKSWFIDFDPVRRNAARARNQPSPSLRPPSPSGRGAGSEGAKHVGEGHYRAGYDFAGLLKSARALRNQQTPTEELFWELVRDRQLMGLKFRRQHQLGDYIADFYCHEHRLVIELDGGIHSEKRKRDHKRDAWMKAQGLTVLRFQNEMLFDDPESVLAAICDVVFPSTSGRGAGGEGVSEALFDLPPIPWTPG